MSKIGFINGSPRPKESLSAYLVDFFTTHLPNTQCLTINAYSACKSKSPASSFEQLLSCTCIVVVAPLYVDALPSHLLSYLQQLEDYAKMTSRNEQLFLYGFMNCGFIEGTQNHVALRVLENYATHMNWIWGGGIGLGGGELFRGGKDSIPKEAKILRPVYEALDYFINCLSSQTPLSPRALFVTPVFSKIGFLFMGSIGWLIAARKNRLGLFKLFSKPYESKK